MGLRLNRASLRREPETAGRYSFNHPKVGSDSFVRWMAQVFRQSCRDTVPGNFESVATGDQKADGEFDPPIERRIFVVRRSSEPTRLESERCTADLKSVESGVQDLCKNFCRKLSQFGFSTPFQSLNPLRPCARICARMSLFFLALRYAGKIRNFGDLPS